MKQLFTFPAEELKQEDTIYVSIALELHATNLTDDKDRIQFENLMDKAEKELDSRDDIEDKDALFDQLKKVRQYKENFSNPTGGIAIYVTKDNIYFYNLAVAVEENITISKLPYVLPLVENFQYEQDYHLLLLNRDSARLFVGHGVNIEELDMTDVDEDAPVDSDTALGTDREGGELSFGTYKATTTDSGGSSQFFHGHNETSKEKEIDREHYFRIVDEFIYNYYSTDKRWPLIVYSIEDNLSTFKSLSKNKYLSDFDITGSPANLKDSKIKEIVSKKIVEMIGQEKREALNEIQEISPQNRVENIPDDLASAAMRGQIDTLYIEKGLEIPGTLTEEGLYDRNDEKNNFLKLLVHQAINTDASIYIFESDDMPENHDIIARLRF